MKPTPAACARLFEVQALRDGRLTGAELARFQAHLAHCPSCTRESQALSSLAHALRSLPAPRTDDLHVRRQRTRLLAAFDATLAPAPPPRAKRWLVPAIVAASVTLTALALLDWRSRPAATAPPTLPSAIAIRADAATAWSRRVDPLLETITLERGTLFVHIDHTLSPRHLLIILPDATLEDLGTTFSVTASPAQTTHVAVQEGTVVLRLRGATPIVLSAGESWSAAPATPTGAPAPSALAPTSSSAPVPPIAQAQEAPRSAGSTPTTTGVPSALAPTSSRAPAPQSAQAQEPQRSADASEDASSAFRAALSALNSGDPAQAATLFAAFLDRYRHDHRTEDAAYLRIIALQRAGNSAAATQAARDYIARYPNGFRRPEVESIAH